MSHAKRHSKQFRAGSLKRKVARQSKENAKFDAETEAMISSMLISKNEEQRHTKT
jgi:hypothetical protein